MNLIEVCLVWFFVTFLLVLRDYSSMREIYATSLEFSKRIVKMEQFLAHISRVLVYAVLITFLAQTISRLVESSLMLPLEVTALNCLLVFSCTFMSLFVIHVAHIRFRNHFKRKYELLHNNRPGQLTPSRNIP